MLLAIDVGNTNTVIGLFKDASILKHWRINTRKESTSDEFSVIIKSLFAESDINYDEIKKVVLSSVVPESDYIFTSFCKNYLKNSKFMNINSESISSLMPVLYTNPKEVGADRLVNSIAAYKKYKRSIIAIDFGTATTFDVISGKGEYIGGAIAPGIKTSAYSLFSITSKLPKVELFDPPPNVIGKDTVSSMKSGILYGYASMVDGMIARIKKELTEKPMVIATGGLAVIMEELTESIETIEPFLTLEGMYEISKLI